MFEYCKITPRRQMIVASRRCNPAFLVLKILLLALVTDFVVAAPTHKTVLYTYHPSGSNGAGLVATMDGPRIDVNDVTTYAYDSANNLISITNPLGHVVQLTDYDARGLAGKIIDANGVETELSYDARGRLKEWNVKFPGGSGALDSITLFDYDDVGQTTRITAPDGSFLDFEYDDAQRLTGIQNSIGEQVQYVLDSAGNRKQEIVKDAGGVLTFITTANYDELSRLMDEIGAISQTTHFDYDSNGNVTSITDPRFNATAQAFDALNRLEDQTDPDAYTVGYTYDGQDRVRTVTDQRGLVTTYNYDAFGNLTSTVSPDSGTTTFEYDEAGNSVQRTDARSVVTQYTYDALNRLTSITYPGNSGENVAYTYDSVLAGNYGKGKLTGITDESGSIDFIYDHRGNIVQKDYSIEAAQYVIDYLYDLSNNLTRIVYPSGRIVDYVLDSLGRVSAITTREDAASPSQSVVSNVAYLPYGPVTSYTYGNGVLHSLSFNQDYRITDIESIGTSTVLDLAYGYDANGNILSLNDEGDSTYSQAFLYDKIDRIEQAIGEYGQLDYQYDGVGNRTQRVDSTSPATTSTYTYDTTSNQVSQVNIDDGSTQTVRTFQYDVAGNTTADTKPDGTHFDFTYNNANRYNSLDIDSIPTATYLYNALGQRTGKVAISPLLDEHYHYNQSGQLLAISNAVSGNIISEYIYLNGTVVGTVAPTLSFVHSDHIGTPQVVTDSSENVVWQGRARPFGETSEPVALQNQNIRFPGHKFDEESGLHYNYFRDYDPSLGRYIQSDPIGLIGGLNMYAYVDGNPLSYIDPDGLRGLRPGGRRGFGSGGTNGGAGGKYGQTSPGYYTANGRYIPPSIPVVMPPVRQPNFHIPLPSENTRMQEIARLMLDLYEHLLSDKVEEKLRCIASGSCSPQREQNFCPIGS